MMITTAITTSKNTTNLNLGKHSREIEFEEGERHLGKEQLKESD